MSLVQIRTAEQLGDIVVKARKSQGIRQEDMAMMIGSSHVLLRNIEKGKPTVNLGSVLQLLDELGIRVFLDTPAS
ncbi:helix-turn-helix domain-containing protein [Pseudomonas sp. R5(2019)]|uniref:helix-turn-helix domain-containing protein n=1 Tax=Pseudomonas sp. R5(2019) TaxID=2697566 RepID=UPI001412280F|nr:helix-turn-helix domain-containing protein [Pseudomonas sp. R5(2019)]NBA93664.1 helix-turn-helix domain-containing protein [Pseudomonas sp. R5(2019)]